MQVCKQNAPKDPGGVSFARCIDKTLAELEDFL